MTDVAGAFRWSHGDKEKRDSGKDTSWGRVAFASKQSHGDKGKRNLGRTAHGEGRVRIWAKTHES